jgi:L-malate glycosyltransferase
MGQERIRLAFLVSSFTADAHGRHLVSLLKGLSTYKYEKHVLCLNPAGPLAEDVRLASDAVHHLGWPQLKSGDRVMFENMHHTVLVLPRLVKLLKKINPDILHSIVSWGNSLGAVGGKLAKTQFRVCSRIMSGPHPDDNPLAAWFHNKTSSAFHLVRCESENIKGDMVSREPVTYERMRVVYDGVNTAKYYAQAPVADLRASLGIPEDVRVVGSAGGIAPHRGHTDILAASKYLGYQASDVHFLFVGRDEGAHFDLLQQARELGISDRVIFAGDRPDAHQLLQCMDVYVNAAHFEGYPAPLVEAMASELPIVATNIGGNLEVVDHQETGLLIGPNKPDILAQRILELLSDREFAMELGRKARRRINDHFSLEAMARRMEAFYREALEISMRSNGLGKTR